MPTVSLTITPFSLNGAADMALLNINGQVVQSTQVGGLPVYHPVAGQHGLGGSVSISLTPEMPGRASTVADRGPWAFMRLLEYGSVSQDRGRYAGALRDRRPRRHLHDPGRFGRQSVLPAGAYAVHLPDGIVTWASVCSESCRRNATSSPSAFPDAILSPLETWLQTAVAASRSELGRGWEAALSRRADLAFLDRRRVLRGKLRRRADAVGRRHRAVLSRCWRSTPARRARACRRLPMRRRKNGSRRSRRGCSASWTRMPHPRSTRVLAGLPAPALDRLAPNARRGDLQGRAASGRRGRTRDTPSFLASIFEDDYRAGGARRSYLVGPGNDRARPGAARKKRPARSLFPYAHASGCGRLT